MVLQDILASVRTRLPDVISREETLRVAASMAPVPRSLAGALAGGGLSVIAEVKRRSPSKGAIDPSLDPGALAAAYERGGAAAISVLTEVDHFGALSGDLAAVRAAVGVPVLRKDFVLHPAQVWEARAMGADAVLLIAAVLSDAELAIALDAARESGLDALVEVHDADEARRVTALGALIVGVNNRNLQTFTVDLATAESLRSLLPPGCTTIAESGIATPEAASRMAAAGYDAVLVGEAAVRHPDPAAFVASLRGQS